MKEFLKNAINAGVVAGGIKDGSNALYLSEDIPDSKMSIIQKPPIPLSDLSIKIIKKCSHLPFILFLRSKPSRRKTSQIPAGKRIPERTYVQSSGSWIMLMFHKLADVQSAVKAAPWLSIGTLIDYRDFEKNEIANKPNVEFVCVICKLSFVEQKCFMHPDANGYFCRACFESSSAYWDEKMRTEASERVADVLKIWADNDELFPPSHQVRKNLIQLWPLACKSIGQAALWIEAAIDKGDTKELRWRSCMSVSRMKVICLKCHEHLTEFQKSYDRDTRIEQQCVIDLLCEKGGAITRKELVQNIANRFPNSMNTSLKRSRMIWDATNRRNFFLVIGSHERIAGLTEEDAQAHLGLANNQGMRRDASPKNGDEASAAKEDDSSKSSSADVSEASFCQSRNETFEDNSTKRPSGKGFPSIEQQHVIDLLREKGGTMPRKELIENIVTRFPNSMNTPFARNRMIWDAADKAKFFLVKGYASLTEEDAQAHLDLVNNQTARRGTSPKNDNEASIVEEDDSAPKASSTDVSEATLCQSQD